VARRGHFGGRRRGATCVHGILVQLPLPQIDPHSVIVAIDPDKDMDGFHPPNVGRGAIGLPALAPCTPQACIVLAKTVHTRLARLQSAGDGPLDHRVKPLAELLIAQIATATVAHSKTRDLPAVSRRADVLFATIGRPELVRGDRIKPGATVMSASTG